MAPISLEKTFESDAGPGLAISVLPVSMALSNALVFLSQITPNPSAHYLQLDDFEVDRCRFAFEFPLSQRVYVCASLSIPLILSLLIIPSDGTATAGSKASVG